MVRQIAIVTLVGVIGCSDTNDNPKDAGTKETSVVDRGGKDVFVGEGGRTDGVKKEQGVKPDQTVDSGIPSAWKPIPEGANAWWQAIWGSDGNNIYVVGRKGSILHYDGKTWSNMANSEDKDLYAVWGTAENVVYAVGEEDILKYDGRASSSDGGGPPSWKKDYDSYYSSGSYRAVWGSSEKDVWAVGKAGEMRHKESGSWSWDSAPDDINLNGVWGVSASEVYIVADGGVIYKKGSEDKWTTMESPTTKNLMAIWGLSGNDIYAAGLDGVVLHYDGTNWSKIDAGTTSYFYAIWGSAADDLFFMGESLFQGDEPIMHFDGSNWETMPPSIPAPFYGAWGTSSTDVYAVGKQRILHFDGTKPN